MIGVGVPIGQEVAGPKKRALFGHRSAHRARQGEGRFQPRNGLTPTPCGEKTTKKVDPASLCLDEHLNTSPFEHEAESEFEKGSVESEFENGSVESTHKVPTSHYHTSEFEKGSVESTHEKGSVESTHKVPTSHYNVPLYHSTTRNTEFEKGSVESTHKVPTSHYHTSLRKGQ